eukprot:PhF_6_TR5937/c0_g1_i1/m.8585/K03094/SKP1, CBF3D; S-phase kinase-associated protein 1
MSTLVEVFGPLTDAETEEFFIVQTKETKKYKVSKKLLNKSQIIREILQDAEGPGVELPLNEIEAETLALVLDFLKYHDDKPMRDIEKPLRTHIKEVLDDWDYQFFTQRLLESGDEKRHKKLLDVLKAANFMIILPLRDLCCACVASMLMGKNEQEILDLFGVTEAFTPQREEELYREYPWLREKP